MTNKRSGKKATRRGESGADPLATLPVVRPEATKENRSRSIFAEAVSPWLVTPWTANDFGMDAMVEIVRARSDGGAGHVDTGRRIGIQLKATDAPMTGSHAHVQVKVSTLRYWLASIEPFALVVCHLPTRVLTYRWIDDALVTELSARDPSWFTAGTVTVNVPWDRRITANRLDEIARETHLVEVRRHRVLAPGTYDRLLTESRAVMSSLTKVVRVAGFESVSKDLEDAKTALERTTYVVALAGRMRAGKSTLFNALVRRDLSPVSRRPTTTVPVFAMSGAADEATTVFEDGQCVHHRADAASLAPYVMQDQNPDNEKAVRAVTVRLVSERLERGIAIVDAPGLFDPSEPIRKATAQTLARANAVLFVLDVSAASSGGFAVESHVLDELKRVLDHSARVFLVLNKSDQLDERDRVDVVATLDQALKRSGIGDRFAGGYCFISAEKAWEWVCDGARGESPIAALEQQIWDYLLTTNATGVARLETAVDASNAAVRAALALTDLRRAESTRVAEVRERLARAGALVNEIRAACARRTSDGCDAASKNLRQALAALPSRMGDEMRRAGTVPAPAVVEQRKNELLNEAFLGTWERAQQHLTIHGHEMNERLEEALGQARLDHPLTAPPPFLAPRHLFTPMTLVGADALGWGLFGGIVGTIISPAWAFGTAVLSLLGVVWFGRTKRIEGEIRRVERSLENHVAVELEISTRSYLQTIREKYEHLERHVVDRWTVFERDVSRQIAATERPLSKSESDQLGQLESELHRAEVALRSIAEQIRWTPSTPSKSANAAQQDATT